MPKKISIENALPGELGDCTVIRADGEIVATVRPVDEGMWLWTTEHSEREVTTAQMRELVEQARHDHRQIEHPSAKAFEFTTRTFKEFVLDLAFYRAWLTDALGSYNAVLSRGGGIAVYAMVGDPAAVRRRDRYRIDRFGPHLEQRDPAAIFPRCEPGERFALVATYVGEPIEVSKREVASVPVALRGDMMQRDWPIVMANADTTNETGENA